MQPVRHLDMLLKILSTIIIAFIFSISCFSSVTYNDQKFLNSAIAEGLTREPVTCILQDHRGYLWIGTADGLFMYNSTEFKAFKHNSSDSSSINYNYITYIFEDKQNNLWIGTIRGLNLFNPAKENFTRFTTITVNGKIQETGFISHMLQDQENNIWLCSSTGLFWSKTGDWNHTQKLAYGEPNQFIKSLRSIYQDKQGALWVSTKQGIVRIERSKKGYDIKKIYLNENRTAMSSFLERANGDLLVGTRGAGIKVYDPKQDTFKDFIILNNNSIKDFYKDTRIIIEDRNGNVWVGTNKGILRFNNRGINIFTSDGQNTNSLTDNSVHCIYEDRKGSIWIGTYYGGLNLFDEEGNNFKTYKNSRFLNSLSSNIVSSIIEDEDHNLWIGTEGEGLNCYNRKTGKFTCYKNQKDNPFSISNNNIKSMLLDKSGNLWIGTLDGLNLLKPGALNFIRYYHNPADPASISHNQVFSIVQGIDGKIWIGTYGEGLNEFDASTNRFKRYVHSVDSKSISTNNVKILCIDHQNNLWVGTTGGLNLKLQGKDNFIKFNLDNVSNSLGSEVIISIYEDSKNRMWVGTAVGGLYQVKDHSGNFAYYKQQNEAAGYKMLSITEDRKGYLWIGTEKGICRFDPSNGEFLNYDKSNGLNEDGFNAGAVVKSRNGELCFGSKNGLVYFHPDSLRSNHYIAPVVFRGIKLFNKTVKIENEGPLTQSVDNIETLTFNHKENIFTIEFAVLNYIYPESNRFAYKLEGFEEDWNYVNTPYATYTNLNPGNYTFLLKGANNNGQWNPETRRLNIRILPPPWKSWWAYSIYGILVFLTTLFLYRVFTIRQELRIAQIEKEKEKELYQAKLQFFTNITHELRTPLTLIKAPIEELLTSFRSDRAIARKILLVKKNANRLLNLVDQLLDFRKQESGNISIKVSNGDIVKFVKEIAYAFREMASEKNIIYNIVSEKDNIGLWFDPQQMEKVFYNIISNAFKFTPKGRNITINIQSTRSNEACITVEDNGKGIPAEHLEDIFERFYRVDNNQELGTGIGLALAKNIVALHHGSIQVESCEENDEQQGYSRFRIILPLGNEHFRKDQISKNNTSYTPAILMEIPPFEYIPSGEEKGKIENTSEKSLLIVEDNDEIREYIRDYFTNLKYKIIEAQDGRKALQLALNEAPDLVISDIMMPVSDGLELCRNIKSNIQISHIPVILLTARTSYVYKVSGYEYGADDYVTKPFDLKLLELKVKNMIDSREKLKHRFKQKTELKLSEVTPTSQDEELLKKLVSIIEKNIEDEYFGVAQLTQMINMSQPVLYRKIKALTDLSIGDFIKNIRLKKAAQLLTKTDYTINEIAYMVGFSFPRYFAKCFKDEFGITPTDYKKENSIK